MGAESTTHHPTPLPCFDLAIALRESTIQRTHTRSRQEVVAQNM